MTTAFEPILDAARIYPVVGAARAALTAADWPAVQRAFTDASAYERHLIVGQADDVDGCVGFLSALAHAHPDDVLAATMLARWEAREAWRLRGSGRASTVDSAAWEGFFNHLRRAELLLIRACAEAPGFTQAWNVRLTTARGLELGPVEERRRYDRLASSSPHDLSAQGALLQGLLPKWNGTWELAHAFVWECTNAAPPGSPNASLVVTYHLERWLDSGGRTLKQVFADAQVRQEILSAGEASVMNPGFSSAPGWVSALSQFALAYAVMEDWPRAHSCFTRLGPYASSWGWDYINSDPLVPFNELRQKAMGQR